MSWLYSRALVEAFSAANCSDGEPSVPSSAKSTPHLYLHSDKTTGTWSRFPSGMMCEPLTDDRGAELLTWYLAGFPAKTSAPRDVVQASPASDLDSGPKWHELSVRYDPATHSWKTHQCLFQEDLPESSVTLPKWGMMRDGVLSERTTLALPTSGTGYGYSLPTPTCSPEAPNKNANTNGPKNLLEVARNGWMPGQMWPTPTTQDNPQIKGKDKRGTTLGGAVRMWPTPTVACATGGQTSRGGNRKNELLLAGAATARENENLTDEEKRSMLAGNGGQLNPTRVEWLMGWPLGWTDLSALATDKFQLWQHSHGKY